MNSSGLCRFIGLSVTALLCATTHAQSAADSAPVSPGYDAELSRRLGANENGMRSYVFVLLKTGSNKVPAGPDRDEMFKGHFANMKRLAADGKLALAGPFDGVDGWRGMFVLATGDIEEAKKVVGLFSPRNADAATCGTVAAPITCPVTSGAAVFTFSNFVFDRPYTAPGATVYTAADVNIDATALLGSRVRIMFSKNAASPGTVFFAGTGDESKLRVSYTLGIAHNVAYNRGYQTPGGGELEAG